jgi:hypothetical protein
VAWTKFGETAFEFITLENCTKRELLATEDWWHKQYPDSFNKVKAAKTGGQRGPSIAQSNAAKRRWSNPKYRAKREEWLATRAPGGQFVKRTNIKAYQNF